MCEKNNLPEPISHERWYRLSSGAGARWVFTLVLVTGLTLLMITLGHLARETGEPEPSPPQLTELTHYFFNSYFIGYLVQVKAVPVILIYFFIQTPLFWRVLNRETLPDDKLRLLFVLGGIQCLTISYEFGMAYFGNDPASFGLLVAIFAGLLGGWRYGLTIGVLVMFFRGTHDMMTGWTISGVSDLRGWRNAIQDTPWNRVWLWNYAGHLWASAAIWAGVVAGLIGQHLGDRRFSPVTAAVLAIGIYAGVGWMMTIGGGGPASNLLFPAMQASALALGAIMLMIRSTQRNASQRRAETAELALARAELRALRAQINPHFLFNALNTIRYFVRTDPDTARQLLLNLSQVMQNALRAEQFVSLQDEIDYVKAYLALEQARLNDRLQISWHLPMDDDLEHPVPALILQPLVENAVIHGIAPQLAGGAVNITIDRSKGDLLLRVTDDGCGADPERLAELLDNTGHPPERACIGLRNIDGRLRNLYGDPYRLAIESAVGQGTRAEIRIPLGSNAQAD
jgi:LytS/YehU family sensor histidine kinase